MSAFNYTRLSILEKLDIPFFIKRSKNQDLFFDTPKVYTKVFVILEHNIQKGDDTAYTIFKGMLKVLNLNEDAFSYAWLHKNPEKNVEKIVSNNKITHLLNSITRFAPENVLILGKNLGDNCLLEAFKDIKIKGIKIKDQKIMEEQKKGVDARYYNFNNIFATYHPKELIGNIEYKKEAYQVLLKLKKKLQSKNI